MIRIEFSPDNIEQLFYERYHPSASSGSKENGSALP